MATADFVDVEIEPGPAAEDGLTLRFKVAGAARSITALVYEAEDGTDGWWDVHAVDDADGRAARAASMVPVEDSSEGTVLLIRGGAHGLLLSHRDSGRRAREPYLLLATSTEVA